MLKSLLLVPGRVNLHSGLYQECKGCEIEHRGEHLIQERFKAKKHVDDATKSEEIGVDQKLIDSDLTADVDGRE